MSDTAAQTTTPSAAASQMADWLIGRIRFYDQVDADEITLDAPLSELGLDSIYVMTLCGDIEDAYGVPIDPTFFADYSTLRALAAGLAEHTSSS